MPNHNIQLTASRVGNTVTITGNGNRVLPRNSGSHQFKFTLVGPAKDIVRFYSLDTEDNANACPSAAGQNSDQIRRVTIGPTLGRASFTDKNDNEAEDMPVWYRWIFTCTDPTVTTVGPFDPEIRNGGNGQQRQSEFGVVKRVRGRAATLPISPGDSVLSLFEPGGNREMTSRDRAFLAGLYEIAMDRGSMRQRRAIVEAMVTAKAPN